MKKLKQCEIFFHETQVCFGRTTLGFVENAACEWMFLRLSMIIKASKMSQYFVKALLGYS